MRETNGAVFLDRDGVLSEERGYVTRADDLVLLPGAAQAVARLNADGWPIVVFTNQAGVGRGLMTEACLEAVHARLRREIEAAGGTLTALYACLHHPDDHCDCRKPKAGMLLQAAREHGFDLTASIAVGDSPRDIAAARTAGCQTALVLSGHTHTYDSQQFPDPQPDHVFTDLADFTDWFLRPV